jgi:hypothetical protein
MSDVGKVEKFKDLYFGIWFVFADDKDKNLYIKISDRRYVTAHAYESRLKHGKNPRKSTIRQIGSINTEVIVQPKGWG